MKSTEGKEFIERIVYRDGKRDLKFQGVKLGWAGTSPDNAHPNYSRTPGRWVDLDLYKSKKGKFICARMCGTQWQGDRNEYEAEVVDTVEQIIEFFGCGNLAKELYESAEIEIVEEVE
jgi:hypothetical protein